MSKKEIAVKEESLPAFYNDMAADANMGFENLFQSQMCEKQAMPRSSSVD